MATDQLPAHSSHDSLIGAAADEFLRRLEAGDPPSIAEFAAGYPEVEEELGKVLATLAVMEQSAGDSEAGGEAESLSGVLGDFRILREIGRGGMGVVYEAEQISLRRRVALKVLPSAAMLDPRALQRFRNEAQAAAALHHGQIVPIYGVGCERGIHYYAMQFIDGLTLAEVITALRESAGLKPAEGEAPTASVPLSSWERAGVRVSPPSPLPPAPSKSATETAVLAAFSTEKPRNSASWFRRIAEQFALVADALHHAHEQGVTHRDIKPGNLMLDRLGNIWITDFGLARIEGEANLTLTGDLVGTLRYMSPEQALAKRIGIDHRTDIYSLGITLYELLTLHPALPGHTPQELLRQVAFDEPKAPRKHRAEIPRDLETIVLKMIEKNPTERYPSATDLASDLWSFNEDRHITARRPSPLVRASRWVKRRRGIVGTAAMILLLAAVGCLSWGYDYHLRVDKSTILVREALQETALRRVVAQTKRDDLIAWEQAASSAQRGKALATNGPVSVGIKNEATATMFEIEEEHERARLRIREANRDAQMLRDITKARLEATIGIEEDGYSFHKAHAAYCQAFLDYGIDLCPEKREENILRIKASPIRQSLVSAIVVWAFDRPKTNPEAPTPESLVDLAERTATDSPAWPKLLIKAYREKSISAIQRLATTISTDSFSVDGVECVGSLLERSGNPKLAEAVFRAAVQHNPGDFWLNMSLGSLLLNEEADPRQSAEAIRYLSAAVAVRPDSAGARQNLGVALAREGFSEEAISVFQEVIRLQPDFALAYGALGQALANQDRFDEAIRANERAMNLRPDDSRIYVMLADILRKTKKYDEAVAACQTALRYNPQDCAVFRCLAETYYDQNKYVEAATAYREILLRKSANAVVLADLANLQLKQGQQDEAEATCREAIRIKPTYARAHLLLSFALNDLHKTDDALAAIREAIRLKPDLGGRHLGLGNIYVEQRRLDDAIAEYSEELRLDPKCSSAFTNIANVLSEQGKHDDALVAARKAIQLVPEPEAYSTLGVILSDLGKVDEAEAAYREAIRLNPRFDAAYFNLASVLKEQGKAQEAETVCQEGIRLNPKRTGGYTNLANALIQQGKYEEAAVAAKESIRLEPSQANGRLTLGIVFQKQGDHARAIGEFREAIRIQPDFAEGHCNLGLSLLAAGDFQEGLREIKKGHELGSKNRAWKWPSKELLRDAENLVKLEGIFPQFQQNPALDLDPATRAGLARFILIYQHLPFTSFRCFERAFKDEPLLADDLATYHRYNATCAALLAAHETNMREFIDDAERKRLRHQAIVWLRDDLAAWRRKAETAKGEKIPSITLTLVNWKADSDLASLRDPKAVEKLSPEDQELCRKLWGDHADLLKQLQAKMAMKE